MNKFFQKECIDFENFFRFLLEGDGVFFGFDLAFDGFDFIQF